MKRILVSAIAAFAITAALSLHLSAQSPSSAPAEAPPANPLPPGMTRIFDGKSLDGWTQEPLNATTISSGDITDLAALAKRLTDKPDPVAAYVSDELEDTARSALADDVSDKDVAKTIKSALAKSLSAIVTGPSIYDQTRFKDIKLRDEARALLKSNPQGRDLARLNRILLEDAFPNELAKTPSTSWEVRHGILASTGAGRGVIYTEKSFDRYRVIFDVRHLSGNPDHRAAVLVFCTPPATDEKPLDALGGIQFQVPNGGTWDYRKGKNNGGKGLFTHLTKPTFDEHQWSRVEILVDPPTGTARMAVAQPIGSKAIEILAFDDMTAGKQGPFALQMHNRGLFDEYANLSIQENPPENDLITTK